MKRARSELSDSLARMRREIAAAGALDGHPHVMPVLDHDADGKWFVMPLARGNAAAFAADLTRPDALRSLVVSVLAALRDAHAAGWVHRDVKPQNILLLSSGDWVLADWGMARPRHLSTSMPGRTVVGRFYGTEGFAAPEMGVDAHEAGPSADFYSLGQVIGWAVTAENPLVNVPLLPASGPWRAVVKAATTHDPARRPQTADDFEAILVAELDNPILDVVSRGEELLARVQAGDRDALAALLDLAERNPVDDDLYIDVLPRMRPQDTRDATKMRPEGTRAVVAALGTLEYEWGYRDFKWADSVILWMLEIAKSAGSNGDMDLFEEAVSSMFAWDGRWDQWRAQNQIRPWIRSLSGDHAAAVARALRGDPDSAEHFSELAEDRTVDPKIRAALNHGGP